MKGRKRNRLREYDYSNNGYYFITICTDKRKHILGKIINSKVLLNKLGSIVRDNWLNIQSLHNNVELDEFVIMPNHIHGIIIVGDAYYASPTSMSDRTKNTTFASPADRTKMILSKLVQQFKRACTIQIRNKFEYNLPIWQRSFYDRVIRNEKELYQIRKYILQNPWKYAIENNKMENLEL